MKRAYTILALIPLLLLSGCSALRTPQNPPTTTAQATTVATQPTVTQVTHSPLYIEGVDVEDVIVYFNEVCLDAEFVNSGDPTRLQKWTEPIRYYLHKNYTATDLVTVVGLELQLNKIEGFPGIEQVRDEESANLQIYFCEQDRMIELMGEQFVGMDGAVTFHYDGNDQIYNATICCRTDIDQTTRNSVILEEIYNGLGPIQDTSLRKDSIIYSEFSTPQKLTDIDELLLKLLYHPQMKCGMTAAECEAVIRQLYY